MQALHVKAWTSTLVKHTRDTSLFCHHVVLTYYSPPFHRAFVFSSALLPAPRLSPSAAASFRFLLPWRCGVEVALWDIWNRSKLLVIRCMYMFLVNTLVIDKATKEGGFLLVGCQLYLLQTLAQVVIHQMTSFHGFIWWTMTHFYVHTWLSDHLKVLMKCWKY